ncbi:predicted protein [Botrytis cinerea T4]|uniref:Uncharacterized protein n=1 Tax=Botryotinia fuckeliana (strain T4) TaxID=999810 RepID=G2YVL4_BOTF4|nr:predicted protein [Botrytis cinerea T4]
MTTRAPHHRAIDDARRFLIARAQFFELFLKLRKTQWAFSTSDVVWEIQAW